MMRDVVKYALLCLHVCWKSCTNELLPPQISLVPRLTPPQPMSPSVPCPHDKAYKVEWLIEQKGN